MTIDKVSLSLLSIYTFFRLTFPLCFAIAFVIGVVPYLSWGPLYSLNDDKASICKEFGWRNLLYINNFYPDSEVVSQNIRFPSPTK